METWKDIKGYDGLYQVSNYGNFRRFKAGKWSPLNPWPNERGYLQVSLSKNGKRFCPLAHRVVLETFHGYKNGLQVNHIDENKANNSIENLEWVTAKENANHGTRLQRIGHATFSRRLYQYRQIDENMETVKIIESKSRLIDHGFHPFSVRNACKTGRKHKGFYWKKETINY